MAALFKGDDDDILSFFDFESNCDKFARSGNLDGLKRLKDSDQWDDSDNICLIASISGNLALLKWARSQNCYWDKSVCIQAAKNGHFQTLKWARENGCDWDKNVCYVAAYYGHLNILKWAIENGCNWGDKLHSYAIEGGNRETLTFVSSLFV